MSLEFGLQDLFNENAMRPKSPQELLDAFDNFDRLVKNGTPKSELWNHYVPGMVAAAIEAGRDIEWHPYKRRGPYDRDIPSWSSLA